jgi:hypothetical protein
MTTTFSNTLEITKNFTKNYFCVLFFKLFLFITLFVAFSAPRAMAQLPNEAFEFRRPLVAADTHRVKLGLYMMGFNKNNEYFNRIADGYTLFGIQAVPYLSYQPTASVRIDAGVFARHDFGRGGLTSVRPLISLRYQHGPVNVIFGTLEGSLNHRLIEPVYDFELVMLNRLEEGLQFLLQKPRTFLDVWINWEQMIYAGSPYQEEVSGGFSFNQQLLGNEAWQLKLPLQMLAYHKGGQIDRARQPIETFVNGAAGLELRKKWDTGLLRSLRFQPYAVWFKDFSHELRLPYTEGHAWYVNLAAATKHFELMLSYWQGRHYVGVKGGALYQSVSSTFRWPAHTEDERQLLILRMMLELPVARNLHVSTRFEPFYDFVHHKIEFSHGMYLNYKTDFNLFRLKPRRRTP